MTVKEILRECQNGTKIEIVERVYSPDGDTCNTVFVGTVGAFVHCAYADMEISYLSTSDSVIVINVSRLKA